MHNAAGIANMNCISGILHKSPSVRINKSKCHHTLYISCLWRHQPLSHCCASLVWLYRLADASCGRWCSQTSYHRIHTQISSPSGESLACGCEHCFLSLRSCDSRGRATGCWRVDELRCRCFPGPQWSSASKNKIRLWVLTMHEITYCQWHTTLEELTRQLVRQQTTK